MNFDITDHDLDLIGEIAKRACKIYSELDMTTTMMDLISVHQNGNPLQLESLLEASKEEFCHDIAGIYNHLDRRTGKLGGCFSPRYSA
jgi:hypothetical protein